MAPDSTWRLEGTIFVGVIYLFIMKIVLRVKKRLEIHWSMLNAHCACWKATLYFSPPIAANVKSLVTDIVTDVLIRFPIISQHWKGAHYFHRVVGLVVINIHQWCVALSMLLSLRPIEVVCIIYHQREKIVIMVKTTYVVLSPWKLLLRLFTTKVDTIRKVEIHKENIQWNTKIYCEYTS